MVHASLLQSATDVEWSQVWFSIPAWLGYTLWPLLPILAIALTWVNLEMSEINPRKPILLLSLAVASIITIAVVLMASWALDATTETNRTNLQDAYGVDLSQAGDEFLVHGTDKKIRDYTLPDGQTTNVTFRVELTEHDGKTRGKLFTVNDDGSTQEVPRVTRLKLDGELDTSSTEPSGTSGDQSGEPADKGEGLNIRDSEVREYLNSITKSDAILEKLQKIDERLAKVESKL